MVDRLDGHVDEDQGRIPTPGPLGQQPLLGGRAGDEAIDLRSGVVRAEPFRSDRVHVDRADPTLDVVLAEQVVDEQERELMA